MKKIIRLQLIFVFLTSSALAQTNLGYYFFSGDDVLSMKNSAQTNWGRAIVQNLRNKVQEREKHSLTVPETGGGYGHNYFCPIHNLQLSFDWEHPHSHLCEACGKTWDNVKKFDEAWISYAHNKNLEYLVANMYLYLITDSLKYGMNIRRMILDYAGKYPGYEEHNREKPAKDKYSGKIFSQSLDEAVWAIDAVRAYSIVKPLMTKQEVQKVEDLFLKDCASMLMRKQNLGNWQAWHNGAIAALGVALENDSIINVAVNFPDYGYRAVMKSNVYPDGWWKEGSALYHFYPLRAILLTAEAVRCRGINLYDSQLKNMFLSPVLMRYADLTFPSLNDGWYGVSLCDEAGLYEIVSKRCQLPEFNDILSLCYKKVGRTLPEALLNGNPVKDMTASNLPSVLFSDLGVAILRSGSTTVSFKYGPDGGVHGHPDKLSFTIHDGKKEILPDMGSTAYGLDVYREWYRNTFSHNTVTVDKKNQLKTCGRLMNFRVFRNGGIVEASTDSAYPGVLMKRKLELKGNTLLDWFHCTSSTEHTYDYMLMLTDSVNSSGFRDTILTEYKRIQKVRYSSGLKKIRLKMKHGILILHSTESFEVLTGVAPGTPPKRTEDVAINTYPLIIRFKGENMDIQATWEFD